jgi:DNA-binding NarL/FixJ family response regulator
VPQDPGELVARQFEFKDMNSQEGENRADLTAQGVSRTYRLLICDDQMMVRTGIRQMLKRTSSIQVIGEASDGHSAVKMALELQPDIVLMDVSMPDLDGVEATRQVLSKAPGIKVLAFSVDSSAETISKMLNAGARGYLFKSNIATELILALQKVLAGDLFLSTKPIEMRTRPRPG